MIVAVVPLKRLVDAKSRLAPVLTPSERQVLVRSMVSRTVQALRDSGSIEAIALVTPEEKLAGELGCVYVPEREDLNRSLLAGLDWAETAGADGALLLPADLPAIGPGDIRTVVLAARGTEVCVVGTRDGGTGALLLTPPHVMRPQFGPQSFRRHVVGARTLGLHVVELEVRGLSFDLDTVEDLGLLAAPLDV